MTAHEQIRAMLDELMGTCRDGEASQNRVRFDDPRVCKSFLLGCCPHDVLANTRMDLGNCPNVHDLALRADYETASKNKDFFYDIDSMEHLQSFIVECDLLTEIAKRRLRETQAELSEEANIKSNRINALGEQIGTLMAKAEEIGATGEVEQTLKMMEEVEALKVKKVQAEVDLRNSMPVSTYQQQKLRVCEVCGAFLGVHDNDRRLADHFGGKLHLGFISIREKLETLKVRIPERKAQRDILLEELRLKRELENKQKQNILSVSDRSRSRSRSLSSSDYEHDSERSSRELSRDYSSNSERTSREHSRDHSFHSDRSLRKHSKDRSFHVSKSTSSSYSKKKHRKRAPPKSKSVKRKSKQNHTRSPSRSRSRSSRQSRSSSWSTRRSRSSSWSTRRSRSSSQVSRSSSQQSYPNKRKSRQSHHSKSRNNKKRKYQRYSRSRSSSRYSRSRSRSWDRTYKNGTSSDSD